MASRLSHQVRQCRLLYVLLALGAGAAVADGGQAALTPTSPTSPVVVSADAGLTTSRPDLVELDLPKSEFDSGEELNLGWVLFRTAMVLGIVVSLIYLTLNVGLRKLLGLKPVGAGGGVISVLERVALDQKRSLFVVRAANEVLLLGGSESSLQLIAKLDSAEVERALAAPGGSPAGQLTLSPMLQKLLGAKAATPAAPAAPDDSRKDP